MLAKLQSYYIFKPIVQTVPFNANKNVRSKTSAHFFFAANSLLQVLEGIVKLACTRAGKFIEFLTYNFAVNY